MKEYKEVENKPMVAGEPQAAYWGSSRGERFVSGALMDELMRQTDEAKLYIISRLSESMMNLTKGTDVTKPSTDAEEWEKQMEAKRDYYRKKFHLPERLIRHIGCIPPRTDEEREKAKEEYLMEKYGRI